MRTIIALAILLTASVANAAPVYLSCTGMTTAKSNPNGLPQTHNDTVMIAIDMSANEITLDAYTFKITEVSEQSVYVSAVDGSVYIAFNRLNGELDISFRVQLNNSLFIDDFDGLCKSAPKRF
jgi:hypothetical protein